MPASGLLYATGALLEGWIAAMLFIGWRALRGSGEHWPGWLCAGYAFNTLRCALLATGYGNVGLHEIASMWNAAFACAALGLMTAALIDYVGLAQASARRINAASTVVLAAILAAVGLHVLARGQGLLIAGLYFVGWTVLFVRAALREPRSGHGPVVVALLTFPVGSIAANAGALPLALLPAVEIIPLAAIGLTVLSTGLIRAHRRAQLEAEAAARALAARELAEGRLRAANETLEQRVAQRTAELRETIEGLESFNRSVSHDLRGPLGGISGVARLARDKLGEGLLDEADAMLAAITRQADESAAMVQALLSLARAGNAQPQRTAVDATALAGEVVATLEACGKTASATVVVQPLPAADADRELLRQVFANLVGNACKFAGGQAAARVEVGHAATPRGQAYFVRDNGIGFAPADAARLFRPFERLNGPRYEGFGVGLSIVQRIVDHHGGRVWAEGAPGAGATFWFTLGGR